MILLCSLKENNVNEYKLTKKLVHTYMYVINQLQNIIFYIIKSKYKPEYIFTRNFSSATSFILSSPSSCHQKDEAEVDAEVNMEMGKLSENIFHSFFFLHTYLYTSQSLYSSKHYFIHGSRNFSIYIQNVLIFYLMRI